MCELFKAIKSIVSRFIQIHGYSEHWFGVSKYGFQPWTAWSTGLPFYLFVTSSLFADLTLPSSFIFMSEDSLRDEYVLCAPDLPIFTHVTQRRPGDSLRAQEFLLSVTRSSKFLCAQLLALKFPIQ